MKNYRNFRMVELIILIIAICILAALVIPMIFHSGEKVEAVSYFPRAIILRHEGEANVAYADGHAGNTKDRTKMLIKSRIGAYIDPTGCMPIITE